MNLHTSVIDLWFRLSFRVENNPILLKNHVILSYNLIDVVIRYLRWPHIEDLLYSETLIINFCSGIHGVQVDEIYDLSKPIKGYKLIHCNLCKL
jgi:hypothetical protein